MSGSTEDAVTLVEKLRVELENSPVSCDGQRFVVTGSFGVASGAADVEDLMKRADAAMYTAKQAGRNRVAVD